MENVTLAKFVCLDSDLTVYSWIRSAEQVEIIVVVPVVVEVSPELRLAKEIRKVSVVAATETFQSDKL